MLYTSSSTTTAKASIPVSFVCLVACIMTLTLTQACRPEMDNNTITLEYMTMRSDVVVYGYPRLRTRDTRFPNHQRYIVDFEVRCIFKGGPLPEYIRIFHVGKKDRMCVETELLTDQPLLLYLRRDGQHFVPTYREQPGATQFLEEIPVLCGITVTYPVGYSKDFNKERCVEEWVDPDCVALPTMQPGTEPDQTETPVGDGWNEPPYQPVKSGDGGNGGGSSSSNSGDGGDSNNKNKNKNKNNNVVKIGDKGSKGNKGGKKSENLEQDSTTPGNSVGINKSSLVVPLGFVFSFCLVVFGVRV